METNENTSILEPTPPSSDDKMMACLSHILTLVGGFLAPLIIYLIKKDESEYIREHAKESLNFQITLFIAILVCIPLCFIFIGVLFLFVIGIGQLILVILATIKANEGEYYKYPVNIRFIK